MKIKKLILSSLIVLPIIISGCVSVNEIQQQPKDDVFHPTVTSSRDVDTREWNRKISKGVADGESWAMSPITIAHKLIFAGETELSNLQYVIQKSDGGDTGDEILENYTVTFVRDGFLDDAVRGDWYEIQFTFVRGIESDKMNMWWVLSAKEAWRCRRPDTGVYQNEVCL